MNATAIDSPHIIALSGGIGAGKSTVAKILRVLGYPVYDCDSRAKALMDNNRAIIDEIALSIASDVVAADGSLIRPALAERVFGDSEALNRLNEIVHRHVLEDIKLWRASVDSKIAFIETAILYQSNIDKLVKAVWEVKAPVDVRVSRVIGRSGLSADQILKRINSQDSFVPELLHPLTVEIVNDSVKPLLPQVLDALSRI